MAAAVPPLFQNHCLTDCLEAIEKARALHERLVEEHDLSAHDKIKIAREVAGLLFAAEAGRNIPNHLRHCFTKLRMDADYRAELSDAEGLRSPTEVWDYYERLEAAGG